MGQWVLGTDSPNVLVGYTWRYIGDGGGIGMAFFVACGILATVRPAVVRQRPVALGVAYGIFVWSGLLATIALSAHGSAMLFALTPKTLAFSLVGHLIYGAVLGACLRRLPKVSLREDSPRLAWRRQPQYRATPFAKDNNGAHGKSWQLSRGTHDEHDGVAADEREQREQVFASSTA